MPQSAPLPKVEATRGYGASVRLCGDSLVDAVTEARAFAEETGAAFIHPYDDRAIIAGQGTLGAEVVGDLTEIGTLVAPIGGGGLMAGVASAIKALSPATTLVGVEAGTTAAYLASPRGRASRRHRLATNRRRRHRCFPSVQPGVRAHRSPCRSSAHRR